MISGWIALLKRMLKRKGNYWWRSSSPKSSLSAHLPTPSQSSIHQELQTTTSIESLRTTTPSPEMSERSGSPPGSPPPPVPPKSPPPPVPQRPRLHKPMRPCQPLLPHTSSEFSGLASSCALPNPPTIHITSPTPSPTSPDPASYPHISAHQHSLFRSSKCYHPSRPAPVPPGVSRRSTLSPTQSCTSGSATPISANPALSRATCRTHHSGRSWRESTISALDRVIVEEGGTNGTLDGTKSEQWKEDEELSIGSPVTESFRHIDGASVQLQRDEEGDV